MRMIEAMVVTMVDMVLVFVIVSVVDHAWFEEKYTDDADDDNHDDHHSYDSITVYFYVSFQGREQSSSSDSFRGGISGCGINI